MNESKDATTDMGAQVTDTSLSETSQAASDQKAAEEIQAVLSQDQPVPTEDAAPAVPPGFLYKVCFTILLLDIPNFCGYVLSARVVSCFLEGKGFLLYQPHAHTNTCNYNCNIVVFAS